MSTVLLQVHTKLTLFSRFLGNLQKKLKQIDILAGLQSECPTYRGAFPPHIVSYCVRCNKRTRIQFKYPPTLGLEGQQVSGDCGLTLFGLESGGWWNLSTYTLRHSR